MEGINEDGEMYNLCTIMLDCEKQNVSDDTKDVCTKNDLSDVNLKSRHMEVKQLTGPRTDHLSENQAIVKNTIAPQRYTGIVKFALQCVVFHGAQYRRQENAEAV